MLVNTEKTLGSGADRKALLALAPSAMLAACANNKLNVSDYNGIMLSVKLVLNFN